jgi:exocyst complex component 2
VRILLTLSNIQGLRNDIMPHLITMFETNFTIKLTDETAKIRQALEQVYTSLFQTYVTPLIKDTDALIRSSIADPDWAPRSHRPTDARPYVYTVLLGLVLVHSEVSTTTAPLTSPIIKHLLDKYLVSFIEAFKQKPRYSLLALLQATLDVEFMTQTLSNYTSEQASSTQKEIYEQLDRLTDNDARIKLQQELAELKVALKKLRESTKAEL